jgi:hypothetical protein
MFHILAKRDIFPAESTRRDRWQTMLGGPIECKCCGLPLKDERGQLRSYFNAASTVKMGVLTDGLVYEFYADSEEPNMMDQTAFLSVDLRQVAKGKIEESVLDGLRGLQKAAFDPGHL